MADVRPFRALRYAPRVDLALTVAPPYDVISPEQQAELYARSPHNVIRLEYGEQRATDSASDDRYTRAAADLAAWREAGVLARDERPAIYSYEQGFVWEGQRHRRHAYFAAVRLEPWDRGVIRPHEHTLAKPRADRLSLLRATRTQISPVYCLYRDRSQPAEGPVPRSASHPSPRSGEGQGGRLPSDLICDFEADGQRHQLSAITDSDQIAAIGRRLAACDVYIADGHHRYETALAYRDEARAAAASWTGEEPENFVLMALTDARDPGLLVLPTHRLVTPPAFTADAIERISRRFDIEDVTPKSWDGTGLLRLLARLDAAKRTGPSFAAIGLEETRLHLLKLRDRAGIEALMPADQPPAWKRLDVSVLQYGILLDVFGIDDAALAAGNAVTYAQDPREAHEAVSAGRAPLAFLLNATPVVQVLAVADAGARMPQKSTYFYPKQPTGLVLNLLAP